MIKIFDANDKDFTSAGNIVINPTKCLEYKKKSLNGWYIEVEVPIKYKDYIEKDKLCVVKTKSKLNPQAFRIGNDIKKTNRKITFTANHVMFDAEDYFLVDVRPTNQNGLNALNYINDRTDNVSPFTIYSNVENVNTAYFIRKNLLEAWATIEERWNGVFDADNWNISFLQSVGHDNGESIIYGKNMQSMEIYEDWSNVVTRLYPVGSNELMLPEKYIESDVQYEKPYTRTVDFQTELEQEEQTEETLIEELRTNAEAYIEENKYPKVSYTTKSDINDNMEIGDTIQVLHPLVTIKTEVLEYQYDIIAKRVKSLTFGNFTRDVKAKFDNIKNTINQIGQTVSNQQTVIQQQTDLINSLNKNGYVYIDDNEILILDKIPKEEAENVWRFGLGGIGFSSNGYEGPFEVAITMDGQINADFITTGTMNVSRIEGLANIISDYNAQIAAITLQLGKIQQQVSSIEEFSREVTGTNQIHLENTVEGKEYVLNLKIKGDSNKFIYLAPNNTLTPTNTLVPLGDHFTLISDKQNRSQISDEAQKIDVLLSEPLRSLDDVYDELNIVNGKTTVTRRIGVDENLNLYELDNEVIENLQDITLKTFNEDTYIYIKEYEGLEYTAKYIIKNDYIDILATKVEMNTAITQTANSITSSVSETYETKENAQTQYSQIKQTTDSISLEVGKKVDDEELTGANIALRINGDTSEALIDADKININGVISANGNFEVDTNGTLRAVNAYLSGTFLNGGQPAWGEKGTQIDKDGTMWCTNLNIRSDNNTAGVILKPLNSDIYNSNCSSYVRHDEFSIYKDNSELIFKIGIYTNTQDPYINMENGRLNVINGSLDVGHINASGYGYFGDYVRATQFVNASKKEKKENIKKLNETKRKALDIVKQTDICEYNFKGSKHKQIGAVLGEGYNTPDEILSEDKSGIDLYSMISNLYRAFQEYIEEQEQKINKLEEKLKNYEMDKENSQKANQNND